MFAVDGAGKDTARGIFLADMFVIVAPLAATDVAIFAPAASIGLSPLPMSPEDY